MPRFFVSSTTFPDIVGPDVHHISHVLRLQVGSLIELIDERGQACAAKIVGQNKERIVCQPLQPLTKESELKTKVTLAQALPKGQKMDWLVEKATELGVWQISPVITARTIASSAKLNRWRKLAKEAAQQSGRLFIPKITEPLNFTELIKQAKQYELAIIPWEKESARTLKVVLQNNKPKEILVLIGPEGGFSAQEVNQAESAGFIPITLGPRILRTETVGLALMSQLAYELE